jgi:hypothetical protein
VGLKAAAAIFAIFSISISLAGRRESAILLFDSSSDAFARTPVIELLDMVAAGEDDVYWAGQLSPSQ